MLDTDEMRQLLLLLAGLFAFAVGPVTAASAMQDCVQGQSMGPMAAMAMAHHAHNDGSCRKDAKTCAAVCATLTIAIVDIAPERAGAPLRFSMRLPTLPLRTIGHARDLAETLDPPPRSRA